MKFRKDMLKFGIGLFIGMTGIQFLLEGNISTSSLISNTIGAVLGGAIYAWWINRKSRHEIFRK